MRSPRVVRRMFRLFGLNLLVIGINMCEIHTATENRRIEEQEAIQRNEFAFKYLKKVYDFKNDDDVYDVIQDANVVFYKKI